VRRKKKETPTPIVESVHSTAALGFTDGECYEQGRPDYPREAVAALSVTTSQTVVDVGCGTGKLTRLLTPTGAHIVGIEPLAAMSETFRRTCPSIPLITAVAEHLPLRASSCDLITCASAFHWFDHDLTLPEFHRVLCPDGRLAIIWNRRDKLGGWAAKFWEITEPYRGETPGYRSGAWRDPIEASGLFGPITEHWFDHVQRTDVDGLIARIESISFIEILPPAEKRTVIARARDFLASHPETKGRELIDLPYHTAVYVTHRSR
jgi:SAM-dependent methyltransferase